MKPDESASETRQNACEHESLCVAYHKAVLSVSGYKYTVASRMNRLSYAAQNIVAESVYCERS